MKRRTPLAAPLLTAVVIIQAIAAIFFLGDAAGDFAADSWSVHLIVEAVVAFALMAGVVFGALQISAMLADARRREEALAVARGALADLVVARFAEWKLTPAEADVAMFALKGCDAAAIAEMRGAATGTVRAQLARVYAKAGVSSRADLVSLFFDDLLDGLGADAEARPAG